ncbi:MAG: metallophosphatase family protein [Rikenellaceae bacterium]|nr:metallophosphatase family protein [Rikenellaceae bacterium]MDE7356313.1 metallophosphatase family protein [Rikenellaceae bacterium]
MIKIGIISDTHSVFDDKLKHFLDPVDTIWHAGDIGDIETADLINAFKPLVAVYGNIDDFTVRSTYRNAVTAFESEGARVIMTHIGGYPGRYEASFKDKIAAYRPTIVVTGHSHILKVMWDKQMEHLHINPGAAGINGFHRVRTAVRLTIDNGIPRDLEVGQWDR